MKYKVWCKDREEWERDDVMLGRQGNQYHWQNSRLNLVKPDNHPIVFYSGRIDNKGEEIYTGHVLSPRFRAEVYQNDEGTFMVRFHFEPKEHRPPDVTLKKYLVSREIAKTPDIDNIIIGHIFENPELLEGK